jgi:hypothetical protein
VWAQSLQQIAALMIMHTTHAQQIAAVSRSPRPRRRIHSHRGSIECLDDSSDHQSPQSSSVKTIGRLLSRPSRPSSLSSLSSPSQSAEALTPTDPAASGAGPSQGQPRRRSRLAREYSRMRGLARGSPTDHAHLELKLPQASCSTRAPRAARRTPRCLRAAHFAPRIHASQPSAPLDTSRARCSACTAPPEDLHVLAALLRERVLAAERRVLA